MDGRTGGSDSASGRPGNGWLDLWAFATSPSRLGLPEEFFWRLTLVEYDAQVRQWEIVNGIKPPLTKEQRERRAYNYAYIMEQQRRALNKEKARQSAMKAEKERRRNGR